jgi:hypothetical protein
MNKYPNSGALFATKTKYNPKSPDIDGSISIERSLLKQMLDESSEDDIVIKLSGWNQKGAKGDFLSIKVNTFKPKPQDNPYQTTRAPVDDSDIPF